MAMELNLLLRLASELEMDDWLGFKIELRVHVWWNHGAYLACNAQTQVELRMEMLRRNAPLLVF